MPSLLEIPVELVERIACLLAPTDLFNLRLTSRHLAAATSNVFGHTCFADRTFLLACPHSMAIIQNVSSLSHLSKFLRKLRFSAATLRPYKNMQCLRYARVQTVERPRQEERRIRKGYAEAYKNLIQDESDFWGQGQYDSLVVVFRNLVSTASTPDVLCPGMGFDYDDPTASKPTGFQRLESIGGHPLPLCYEHFSGPTIGYIYEAILETEFPVRHLELGTDAPGIPIQRLVCPYAHDHFKYLHTLRLYVVPEPEEEATDAIGELLGILFNAPNLRQLTLGISDPEGCHAALFAKLTNAAILFARLTDATCLEADGRRWPYLLSNLTDLELVGHYIDSEDLRAFLGHTSASLQRISIKDTKYGDWAYREVHPTELTEICLTFLSMKKKVFL